MNWNWIELDSRLWVRNRPVFDPVCGRATTAAQAEWPVAGRGTLRAAAEVAAAAAATVAAVVVGDRVAAHRPIPPHRTHFTAKTAAMCRRRIVLIRPDLHFAFASRPWPPPSAVTAALYSTFRFRVKVKITLFLSRWSPVSCYRRSKQVLELIRVAMACSISQELLQAIRFNLSVRKRRLDGWSPLLTRLNWSVMNIDWIVLIIECFCCFIGCQTTTSWLSRFSLVQVVVEWAGTRVFVICLLLVLLFYHLALVSLWIGVTRLSSSSSPFSV